MTSEEVPRRVLAALSLAGVEHMVVGSFSSNLYGVTHSTKDLDVVVSWCDRHGTREVFEQIRASVPNLD